MVVRKPLALTGTPAEDFRQGVMAEYSGAGVFGTNDLAVTAQGTPNMSVNVAPGYGLVAGTLTANQGFYTVFNDATVNLAIAAANATLPRIDIVVATVRDSDYSGANKDAILQVITGTAASSPVAPAVPASSLFLAQIAVGANVTSITSGNITDKRTQDRQKPAWFTADTTGATPVTVQMLAGQTGLGLRVLNGSGVTIVGVGPFGELYLSNFGTAGSSSALWGGAGAPASGSGNNGDYYIRSDTPGTAGQRIYVKSGGAWVGIV
jgi:hypothetical protein